MVASLIQALITEEDTEEECRSAFESVRAEAPGAKDSVPALRRYLAHEDPRVREKAAYILGWVGLAAHSALGDLRLALQNEAEPETVRRWCAWALGQFGPVAVPILVDTLRTSDPRGRQLAASELGSINSKAAAVLAIPGLVAALGDTDPDVARFAQTALERIGPAAVTALTAALAHQDPLLQAHAAAVLIHGEPFHPEAVKTAVACLQSPRQEVRHIASWALYQDAGSHKELTVSDYIALLHDEDRDVRGFGAVALRNIGPPESAEALPALLEALNDADINNQVFVIQALGDLGPMARQAIPHLIEKVPSMEAAVEALGRIGSAARAALPLLQSHAESLRSELEAARRTGTGGYGVFDPSVQPYFENYVQEQEGRIERVIASIEGIEGNRVIPRAVSFSKATVPELIQALQDKDSMIVIGASGALVRRGALAVPGLIGLLWHKDKQVRAHALTALREIGPRAALAIPALIKGFADQEEYSEGSQMRDLCIMTVVSIGEAAIPPLREAERSSDRLVRKGAAKALKEIASSLLE